MTTSPASRRAADSRARRKTKTALIVGFVLAGALAVASLWVSWLALAGIAVAVIAGIVAVAYAWVEFREYRAERNEEAHDAAQAHLAQLRQVRADHSSVMDVLTTRNDTLRGELREAKAEAGELQSEASRLRGDLESARVENTDLRTQLATHEALVAELRSEQPGEEPTEVVAHLPRRRATGETIEGWEAAEAETVIDLDLARLATPFVEDVVRRHAN